MTKKILLISNYKPGVGGISGQVEILHRRLNELGYYTEIFNTLGSAFSRLTALFKLLGKSKGFSVFHIHACSGWGGFFPAVVGIVVGRLTGKKILLTYHGGDAEAFFNKNPVSAGKVLRCADQVIVLSGFLKKIFDVQGVPSIIIPNVLEGKVSIRPRSPERKTNFISIRSLRPLYNIGCILKAFALVQKQVPESTLTLLGRGPELENLKKMAADLCLRKVSFVGRVENKEVEAYLLKAEVMLSAPLIDNMPVSVLEGFRAGLVVISSNVGGVCYLIKDGVNGLLFQSNDHHGLAKQMMTVIENSDKSRLLAENAKASLEQYSWEVVSRQLLPLYN